MTKPGEIPLGSEITTGPDSYAEIELWDGGLIRIAPNSTVKISGDFCDKRTLIQKAGSKVWHKIKNLLGGGGYESVTERCAVGVRGTEFEIYGDKNLTTVKVYEGKVEVTPLINEDANKLVLKSYEKLMEDMQSGKISMEEYTEKITAMNDILEGNRQFPVVMIEAGYMTDVTFEVSEIKTIPSDNYKWFEDPKFNR